MQAEIICIGTELLVGSTLNTNARFLSQKLAENAVDVYHHVTVGDNEERVVEALKNAAKRADILITTGGLGPTEDDITSHAVAHFLGRERLFHQTTYKLIQKRFEDRRLKMDAIAKAQCYVPEGATILDNIKGTAPGLICEFSYDDAKKWLIVLPGPPRELEPMFTELALPLLFKKMGAIRQHFVVRGVRVAGLLETQVAKKVTDLLKLKPPTTVGIYAKPGEVELKIMAKDNSLAHAKKNADKIERLIKKRLGVNVYGIDKETLASATGLLLKSQKKTLAMAESCTGGLVSHMMTQASGSSAYFIGSIIAYSNRIKTKELGISEALLKKYGAVSSQVAKEMAQNVKKKFSSDYGVGITGIAGPDGGSKKKPVGLVYVAISSPKKTNVFELRLLGTRTEIKFSAAQRAIGLLRLALISSRTQARSS